MSVQPPFRIVLADDEPLHNQLLGSVLQHEGYEVVACTDGAAALAEVSRGCHCLITDYHMPGMDGLELLQAVQHLNGTPCILLTGSDTGEVDDPALAAGASAVLHKPTHPQSILGLLNLICSGKWRAGSVPAARSGISNDGRGRALAAAAFGLRSR